MSFLRHAVSFVAGLLAAVVGLPNLCPAADLPEFITREIDPRAAELCCYAVTIADVDGDKQKDIVVVTESRVVWYHNPDWKMRVIIDNQTERDNVCIAPHDIDGDGKIDFALGAGWLNNKNLGTLYWLSRGNSLDEKWAVHPIGRESWAHRVRWGDILGTGRPQLILSPLNKTQGNGVHLLAFEIPAQPKTEPWRSTLLDGELNAMHNHWMVDLDGDGRVDALTASQEGVFFFRRDAQGTVVKQKISDGAPGPDAPQQRGAGEIRVGKLAGGAPFIVTVEPMHGNAVVVYTRPAAGQQAWNRLVVDDTLKRGHAIGVADVDHDGADELIIGHSDKGTGDPTGPGVFIYRAADAAGTKWKKQALDNGGVATEDMVVDDLNGDGWPDVVAVGRATLNVKLYVNQGSKK
ncbi:MAG: VCBS repeat-containing protein [Planctomycetes bacterium]|nr:VCBS repeat-containing protein [Planctomycetota bacterium]